MIKQIYHKFKELEKDRFYKKNYGEELFDLVCIATTTHCNFQCRFCPNSRFNRGLKRNEVLMDEKVFFKIINDLKKANYKGEIQLHHFNEPLTDKRIIKFMRYVGLKLPKCKIIINTNGSLLNFDLYSKLVDLIDMIIITQYNKKMLPNIKKLFKEIDKEGLRNIILHRIGNVEIFDNIAGLVPELKKLEKPICSYPDNRIIINPQGNVVLCSYDYFSQKTFGNVKDYDLVDIWKSKSYQNIRKNIKNGVFTLPICKRCRA